MQTLTILGATGSIGLSTLDVIARHPEQFELYAVTGNTNVEGMLEICRSYSPKVVVMADESSATALKAKVSPAVEVLCGEPGLVEVASHSSVTTVMAAIVGGAGLKPTIAAAKAGKRILLANKEALVMSGDLFLKAVKDNGATLLPVDSEHNAIFQVMPEAVQLGGDLASSGVNKILLTGSGGPFLNKPVSEFGSITPEQAVAHPNWSMGAKISVDSATMMNKGLEFIEARLLFNAAFDEIEVVVHPQSIIHSMVSYADGSVLAQMGRPDMRTPIAHCLSYPNRIASGVEPLDFSDITNFSFQKPDFERFPNLALALEASKMGQAATTALNASNEVTVESFLNNEIRFTDIGRLNAVALERFEQFKTDSLSDIVELDAEVRKWQAAQLKRAH